MNRGNRFFITRLTISVFFTEGEKPETKQKRLEAKYAALQIAANIDKIGNAKQAQIAKEGDLLTRERLCCGLSIFEVRLNKKRALFRRELR